MANIIDYAGQGGNGPGLPGPHKIYEMLKDDPKNLTPAAEIYRLLVLADAALATAATMKGLKLDSGKLVSGLVKACVGRINTLTSGI